MDLEDINSLAELVAAINEYFVTPRRPPIKGAEENIILQKMITLIPSSLSTEMVFESGAVNPILITNWQATSAALYGNRPSLLICAKLADDGNGNPAENDRNDIRPLRYYSDSPTNEVLTSISIDTGDGDTLSNDYVIKITR